MGGVVPQVSAPGVQGRVGSMESKHAGASGMYGTNVAPLCLAGTYLPKPTMESSFTNLAFLRASLLNLGDGACIPQCHPGSASPALHAHTREHTQSLSLARD